MELLPLILTFGLIGVAFFLLAGAGSPKTKRPGPRRPAPPRRPGTPGASAFAESRRHYSSSRRGMGRTYEIGATGEQATARLLSPLRTEGWTILHDRKAPGSRANLDHVAISKSGTVVVVDSKKWARARMITYVNGQLRHGTYDRTRSLGVGRRAADCATKALGKPVLLVWAVHHAPIQEGEIRTQCGTLIVPAHRIAEALRSLDKPGRGGVALGRRARTLLPPA